MNSQCPIRNAQCARKSAKRKPFRLWAGRLLVALVLAFWLTGCAATVREAYQRPEVVFPKNWQTPPATGEQVLAADRWWQAFDDSRLNALIELALKTNNDLAAAAIKVRKARLEAGLEATNRIPDFSASAGASEQWDLDSGDSSQSASTSTSLSWELDLWGKLAASRDAAQWEARATEQDRANTALTLVGTTAGLYWQIAYLNRSLEWKREDIVDARRTLDIVRVKYRAGAVAQLDLLQAEQDLESQKADLADLKQQMAEAGNSLAVLFDRPPGKTMVDPKNLNDMPLPALAAGIPAAVLGNRPDLKAAEMRLRSTLEDANSTRASYYPNLSLTSSLGTSSTELIGLLKNPVATLGANLTLPFVQWNEAKYNARIADATYEQAVVAFRQSLYDAPEGCGKRPGRTQTLFGTGGGPEPGMLPGPESRSGGQDPIRGRSDRHPGLAGPEAEPSLGQTGIGQKPLRPAGKHDDPLPGPGRERRVFRRLEVISSRRRFGLLIVSEEMINSGVY